MSTKKKLVLSLSVLSLTLIIAIVSVVGVFALLKTDFTVGGSITFTPEGDVYATISEGTVTNGALLDTTKLKAVSLGSDKDAGVIAANKATWTGLVLTFPNGADVTIEFTITNHSLQDGLEVKIGELEGTATNATMSAAFEGTSDKTVTIAKAVAGTPNNTEHSKKIIITFKVVEKNDDAKIEGFKIPITLKEVPG